MNSSHLNTAIRPQVMEEAAGWLVECQAGEIQAAQRAELDAWLRASPEHVRAYLELLPLWDSGTRVDTAAVPDIATLIEWARGSDTNVVRLAPVQGSSAEAGARTSWWGGAGRLKWALAAASLVLAILMGWHLVLRDTYRTGTGEQRSIALADGSLIELNSQSTVRIRYSDGRRGIELVKGQALFKVSHDANRPFVVESGETRIRAVGTQFDVYRTKRGAIVTVVEGRVAVSKSADEGSVLFEKRDALAHEKLASASPAPRQPGASPIFVTAGQQLTGDADPEPIEVDVARVTAWTERRLIFSATPLTDVADEFNRYNERRLVLQGPGIDKLRINGVFSSMDSIALLAFLKEQPGVTIAETATEVRVTVR